MDPITMLLIGSGILWVWIAFKYSGFSEKKPWSVLRRFQKQAFWWCVTGLVLGVFPCLALWAWEVKPTVKFATSEELRPTVLQNMNIRIADLTRESFRIEDRVFENCHIYGPAVIHGDYTTIGDCGFVEVTPETIFITTTNTFISGIVELDRCTMKKCTFHKISFIGDENYIRQVKRGFTIKLLDK